MEFVLKWVKQVVVEFPVSIVMGLLDYPFLYGRDRPLIVVVHAICSFGAEVSGKRFGFEGSGFDEGGVEAGLADEIVFDCE